MSSIITALKDKIKAELAELPDFDAEHIKDYPTIDFQSYPAAIVRSDEQSGDYETTSENYEEYTYTIFLLMINTTQEANPAKSRQIMEELVGDTRMHFDADEFLSGLSLPTGYSFLGIRPTNGRIFDEESGKFVVGEIRLACRVSKGIQ